MTRSCIWRITASCRGWTSGRPRKRRASSGVQSTLTVIFIGSAPRKGRPENRRKQQDRYLAWPQNPCQAIPPPGIRSEEHTSELQSLMRISYAVFCLKKKHNNNHKKTQHEQEKIYK